MVNLSCIYICIVRTKGGQYVTSRITIPLVCTVHKHSECTVYIYTIISIESTSNKQISYLRITIIF